MQSQSRTRGFTLIELLVVVAIVAMLIAILLPMLERARSQAREVKCATQLREYARGFTYYFADYDDVFPAADYGAQGDIVAPPTWHQLIERYWRIGDRVDHSADQVNAEQYPLGRCPELEGLQSNPNQDVEWEWDYSWRTLGYGYNRFWLGWNNFGEPPFLEEQVFWRRLATVKQPAKCVMLADCNVRCLGMEPQIPYVGHYLGWATIAKRGAGVNTRHAASSDIATVPSRAGGDVAFYLDGRGNIAWVDGHVSARESVRINDKQGLRHLWDPTQTHGKP